MNEIVSFIYAVTGFIFTLIVISAILWCLGYMFGRGFHQAYFSVIDERQEEMEVEEDEQV